MAPTAGANKNNTSADYTRCFLCQIGCRGPLGVQKFQANHCPTIKNRGIVMNTPKNDQEATVTLRNKLLQIQKDIRAKYAKEKTAA